MKIQQPQYDYMKRAIEQLDDDRDLREHAAQYKNQGLSPMRFRWDCSHGAALTKWICDNVYRDGANGDYTGVDDSHIDTVLRNIMRELGLTWAAQK